MKDSRELIKHKLADFYDKSAREYHINHYISGKRYSPLQYRQHYIENMIKRQNIPKNARILDVGCGPGELTVSLLKKGYDLWGVDISQRMIEEATKTIQENGFTEWNKGAVGDIEYLNFDDNFFDVVVAAGVIEYQKDDKKAFLEVNRVLKKDGFLILNITNRYSYIKILDGIYTRIKKNNATRRMLDFIKNRLLRKGKVRELPTIPDKRVHSPKVFDEQIEAYGFQKISHNYFHFSLLPKPLDSIFPFINEPISKKMEALTNSRFDIFGGGYIVIARKIANIDDLPPRSWSRSDDRFLS
jgi:ubiquinone/menaquinone biosynthesis C-methylase UbiE